MLTYYGLLDDFALRHNYNGVARSSVDELNGDLIMAVLFGDPLLINDGYILNHSAAQEAITYPNRSPLRNLVENGYVKILTRNDGNLADTANAMAANKIDSAKNLIKSDFYLHEYQPALKIWSKRLDANSFRDSFMSWPNIRIHEIFKSVADTAYRALHTAANPKQKDQLDLFDRNLKKTESRRTEWEKEAGQLLENGGISENVHQNLMLTANEIYQYSIGCALGKDKNPVKVLTAQPIHLKDFSLPLGPARLPKHPVNVPVADLGFATDSIDNRWNLLAAMVTPGNDMNIKKSEFLNCLENYYVSDNAQFEEVRDAAKSYGAALSQHFSKKDVSSVIFSIGILGSATVATIAIGGPPLVGVVASLALGVSGIAAEKFWPQALWRLTAPNTEGWLTTMPNQKSVINVTSCFQLSPCQISMYTEKVSPYRP